jgi:cell division protease FtsH
MRQMQSGGSAALKFGKTKAKVLIESTPKVTFKDVAGCDEAKQELQEIIEFLKEPQKFQRLGGRIPKGALLLGPPGSGKTLLAKAVAGEAGVPFFSMSGSDFVEMFVGVGASRVRDLFEQGKRNAPASCSSTRSTPSAGTAAQASAADTTSASRRSTSCWSRWTASTPTRASSSSPPPTDRTCSIRRCCAPGASTARSSWTGPTCAGREGILRVHARNIPVSENVDLSVIARATPGMAGADLANMVNEGRLLAARRNRKKVTMQDFQDAKDKVMLGMERKSLVMTEDERRNTAYHEAGHALVAWLMPGSDPVDKVTIIPRGRALGITSYLPTEERHSRSREDLIRAITMMMGGRAAEQLVFSHLTTGAANDLERATGLARRMVCELGMSDKLGPLTFGKKEEMVFLGKEIATHKDYSEQTAISIDEEVRVIAERCYEQAFSLLKDNLDKLHLLARRCSSAKCSTATR